MVKKKDYNGQRFGRLVVIGEGEPLITKSGKKRRRLLCQCDCGRQTVAQPSNLVHGSVRSCGCIASEVSRELIRKLGEDNRLDISNQKFGRLTAIEPVESDVPGGVTWRCICDCGKETYVKVKDLRNGGTKSCGCLRDEKIAEVNKSHGESHTRLYNVWNGMRQRCKDPSHKSYKNYGGRGICFCDEWEDYTAFRDWALKNGYSKDAKYGQCTLDRIDVNKNYSPDNCRWVDSKTQASNKRNSRHN